MRLFLKVFISCIVALSGAGCLPGSDTGLAPVSNKTPSDEVFVKLLEAIEERRQDQFVVLVSSTCQPDRDTLYKNLSDYYATADNIEYQVTVVRRLMNGENVTYVFEWSRKHTDRASASNVVSAKGTTEWTVDKSSGRYLLSLVAGDALF